MQKDIIFELGERTETVWRVGEIAQIVRDIIPESLHNKLRYLVRVGKLQRVARGIYARRKYEPKELANKLYVPSYVSLETVLVQEGIVFQYYERIFMVSYVSREVKVGENVFQYRGVKKTLLSNPMGIIKKNNYFEATRERAWLDAVYLYRDYHFDHLDALDWDKVWQLLPIYQNKEHKKRVREYYQIYLEEK